MLCPGEALHKNPNLTADDTDNTDLHGSKSSIRAIFRFVNLCDQGSSGVRFAFVQSHQEPMKSLFAARIAGPPKITHKRDIFSPKVVTSLAGELRGWHVSPCGSTLKGHGSRWTFRVFNVQLR